MPAVLAHTAQSVAPNLALEERAERKGGIWRALPAGLAQGVKKGLMLGLLLSGSVLTGQALYIPVKAEVAQVLLTRAFERSVETGSPVKPWSWADTAPIARVTAPRLGVSEVVLSGGSGEAMAFGPTAILDDPARRITVLAAHRDTHFEFVRDLKVGDAVALERIDGSVMAYRITRFETVEWDAFAVPGTGGDGLIALTTCYPFDTDTPGPLRRVAWGEKIGGERIGGERIGAEPPGSQQVIARSSMPR